MKKGHKIALLTLSISSLLLSAGAVTFACLPRYIDGNDRISYADSAAYEMDFDYRDRENINYYYGVRNISKLNYNNAPIQFNYQRCRAYGKSHFLVISGGGCFYNPHLVSSPNNNSLNGISSMTVTFSSTKGNLYLSYGLSESYVDTGVALSSGVAFNFESFKPSHFKLYTDDNVNADYDVYISSIKITYHSDNYYEQSEYVYTDILSSQGQKTLAVGDSETFSLKNTDIGTNNYLRISYKSSENLTGVLTYLDQSTSSQKEEYFFLEKTTSLIDFKTFLDAFRKGSAGANKKTLISFTLTNVGTSSCTYTVSRFSYTNRIYSRSDTYYISDTNIEAGISLQFGGSIASFKNLNLGIQEYVDAHQVVKIRASNKHSGDVTNVIANNPNLINIHDVGREIQQSWYMNVGADQGYSRATYAGNEVCYNPVQAGDQYNNESKIVDYKITYDKNNAAKVTQIWIKTMALDWAQSNIISKSYMENTYSVDNGLLSVKNRYIDFSGWNNYENNAGFPTGTDNRNGGHFYSTSEKPLFATQELPAVYTAHPLEYFASNFTNSSSSKEGKLIFDNNLGFNTGTKAIEKSDYLVANGTYEGQTTYQVDTTAAGTEAGAYHYEFRKHSENWMGYFNEDKFGLACYMPVDNYNHDANDRHVFVSGMLYNDHTAANKNNRYYLDENYKSQLAAYSKGFLGIGVTHLTKESCYVDNTGYLSTVLGLYVPNYQAMEYTYVLGADYLNTLRSKFTALDGNRTFNNDFTAWPGANI